MNIASHHKTVSLDELSVDPRVQRVEGVDHRRVNSIAQTFDWRALGTILVSHRKDGTMVVLDGMHRTAAARQVGYKGLINAEVITGLTVEQEAHLFLLHNASRSPSAISKFRARVVAAEPMAVEMSNILSSHGWRVAPRAADGVLTAVDAVERIYTNGGGVVAKGIHAELLDRTLSIVTAAWDHDRKAVDGNILLAVAQLLGRFGASVDTSKLVAEMQGTRPGTLVGRAKNLRDTQGGTVPAAMARILAGMHNKKRRTNLLPEWVWIR